MGRKDSNKHNPEKERKLDQTHSAKRLPSTRRRRIKYGRTERIKKKKNADGGP